MTITTTDAKDTSLEAHDGFAHVPFSPTWPRLEWWSPRRASSWSAPALEPTRTPSRPQGGRLEGRKVGAEGRVGPRQLCSRGRCDGTCGKRERRDALLRLLVGIYWRMRSLKSAMRLSLAANSFGFVLTNATAAVLGN